MSLYQKSPEEKQKIRTFFLFSAFVFQPALYIILLLPMHATCTTHP